MSTGDAEERAKVVAWLRAGGQYKPCNISPAMQAAYNSLADAIEVGEHLASRAGTPG